jgi:hypothetical protein
MEYEAGVEGMCRDNGKFEVLRWKERICESRKEIMHIMMPIEWKMVYGGKEGVGTIWALESRT